MTIIIPMIIIALVIGLSTKQTTSKVWGVLVVLIISVIAYAFVHPPKTSSASSTTTSQ